MSTKYLVFDNKGNDLYYFRDGAFYEVINETNSIYVVINEDGISINVAKENSIYKYKVIESYPVPDNISYWEPATDNVTNPSHYTNGNIETIDYLKDTLSKEQYEGFCRGNVLKYLSRYPHKNGVEDLNKAKTYLEWLIESVEE